MNGRASHAGSVTQQPQWQKALRRAMEDYGETLHLDSSRRTAIRDRTHDWPTQILPICAVAFSIQPLAVSHR